MIEEQAHCLVYEAAFLRQLPKQCPRRLSEGEHVSLWTGELTPHRCCANICPSCVSVKARQVARAVGAATPEWAMTLTHVGDEWSTVQRRMNRLRRDLQRRGYVFEWAYTVECNHDERWHRHHVHALGHGDMPPEYLISELAQRTGMGSVSQNEIVKNHGAAAGYLFNRRTKRHRYYALNLRHTLAMQGGQIICSTGKFWRVNGEQMGSLREAIRSTWIPWKALTRNEKLSA